MINWLPDPLALHFYLLLPAGVLLVSTLVLQGRPGLKTAWRRRLLQLSTCLTVVFCSVLSLDANLRSMPYPYRVFPLVFLGLFVVSHEVSSGLLHRMVNGLLTGLRSPRVQVGCFAAAIVSLLALLTIEPLFTEENFGPQAREDDTALWNQIDRFQEVTPSPFRTDLDRPVRALVFTSGEPATGLEKPLVLLQRTLLTRWEFQDKVIALPMTWLPCNCHGYVFADGKYLIPNGDVDTILEDNGYLEVSQPRLGDIIVYRDAKGAVAHSGLVRGLGDNGIVFVESKWGKLGRFLHPHTVWPQRDTTPAFYRTARRGHTLLPAISGEAVGAE